jgi:amidase
MMSEFEDAATLAAQIASGEVPARAALDGVLGRIDSDPPGGEPPLNAVVVTRADAARREADAIDDARARGERLGPLAGVPVTLKEAFDVAGLPTTWGLAAFTGHRATADAEAVQRLRAAGAIVVGKTNVATMLADFAQTDNEVYGRTVNPHDRGRSPGGSSGGAAAAVAAGHSYLDVGSDLAGSIRVPAAWCGVYGLKASAGAIPTRGFQPPGTPAAAHPLSDMLALGPFARSATDLLLAHAVLSQPASPQPMTPMRGLADCRVGVVLDNADCPTDPDTAAALSDLVDVLAARGVAVHRGWPDGIDPAQDGRAFGALIDAYLAFAVPERPDPAPQDYADAVQVQRSTAAAWRAYFAETDVFLIPAVVTTAITHDARPFDERRISIAGEQRPYLDLAQWIAPASLPGLPVVTAPIGLDHSGLPIGMQILAARDHDRQAIRFAQLCAEITR